MSLAEVDQLTEQMATELERLTPYEAREWHNGLIEGLLSEMDASDWARGMLLALFREQGIDSRTLQPGVLEYLIGVVVASARDAFVQAGPPPLLTVQ
jgi:hypothetical protein